MKLINWWFTPKFPEQHIANIGLYRPNGFKKRAVNFYKTWLAHPIKRRVAKYYIFLLQRIFGLKVIGITGSAGKTTTKEILASILSKEGKVVYSYANIDPIYNIPSTIFHCTFDTKYLVIEMGVEYPTEMDFYLWLVKPDVGVIINTYPTHILYFKDEQGVYKEKSKLVKFLSKNNFAVLNSEDKYLKKLEKSLSADIIWFGNGTDIFASNVKYTKDFKTSFNLHLNGKIVPIKLSVLGRHIVNDSLAAAATASCLGVDVNDIKYGSEVYKGQEHRMKVKKLKSGVIAIDDSYNSNPKAAMESIATLKELAGERKTMIVFGDMLELGMLEEKYHRDVRRFIKKLGIDYVVGVGKLSGNIVDDKEFLAESWKEALPIIRKYLVKNMVVLIKGSRSMAMENIARALR